MTDNPHEVLARWRKVAKLIAEVYAHGLSIEEAIWFGDEQWGLIAQSACLKPPSAETIELLVEVLGDASERADRRKGKTKE